MAFAVEPYIFDWIFFDDSSELKTWRFRLIRRAATEYPQKVYIFATDIGSVCAYISSCVGYLCCLFVLQVAKTSVRDKLMQWPALFYGLIW